jgi:hypothetical protein
MRHYLFAFENKHAARIFVRRLVLSMSQLAIYVDDCHVQVIDGAEIERRERILQLARNSAALRLLPSKSGVE